MGWDGAVKWGAGDIKKSGAVRRGGARGCQKSGAVRRGGAGGSGKMSRGAGYESVGG